MHKNKQKPYCYSVSNGIQTSSFEIWTANLAQSPTIGTLTNSWSVIFGNSNWKSLQNWLPRRHPGTQHSDALISVWGFFLIFFMLLFVSEKNQKPVRYTRTLYSQTGENTEWAEAFVWCLLLIFKVVYWDYLTQVLPFTWDFVAKGQRQVWGQMG